MRFYYLLLFNILAEARIGNIQHITQMLYIFKLPVYILEKCSDCLVLKFGGDITLLKCMKKVTTMLCFVFSSCCFNTPRVLLLSKDMFASFLLKLSKDYL